MTLEYRRLRAPAGDGQSLEIPALDEGGVLLAQNQSKLNEQSFTIASYPAARFRQTARHELLKLANNYTRQYRDIESTPHSDSFILAGHQPAFFHPGVWFKNYCLSRLATRHLANGINLIIDNDLCTSKSLRVPTGSVDQPETESIAFDSGGLMVPYEMQRVQDPDLFGNFGERVVRSISPLIDRPMMAEYWRSVLELQQQIHNPFSAIAAARHRFEGSIGLNSLEVPLSTICKTESFWQFAAELLNRSAELLFVYNDSVRQYRETHRVRSQSHPVPDLSSDGDGWNETPFWVWSDISPTRRRLMIRAVAGELELTDRAGWKVVVLATQLVERIHQLAGQGVCIRPRALVTTMYARLVLGDLFLHGIGGAKYDQLTDAIISRFFQVRAPEFMVLTSTNKLPVARTNVTQVDVTSLLFKLRELIFHPETAIDSNDAQTQLLVDQKQQLLGNIPISGSKRDWHQQLSEVNAALHPIVESVRQELSRELLQTESELAKNRILGSREFAWPLFPDSLVGVLSKSAGIELPKRK